MVFEIQQGLFQLDFTDNHAIVGVPIDAEFSQIRKRYMRLARQLHPDTCPFDDPEDKELAKQLLAKLLSPAYNKFSKEKERKEYNLLLKTIGDRAIKQQSQLKLTFQPAKDLLKAGNYQQTYETQLADLAKQQYQNPQNTLDITGQISELNLAYLLRKGQKAGVAMPASASASTPSSTQDQTPTPPPPPPQPKKESFVEQACRRAEQLMETRNYAQAVLELKDAIKREPTNSRCHGLLGLVYLKQNQPKLATPHIKRALQLDPKQPSALEAKKLLDKVATTAAKSKSQQKSGGGFLGGLFGGKKK
ncbi:MAG: DnaJ domain-containing protein [Microcoleaceae cyanobacterium]